MKRLLLIAILGVTFLGYGLNHVKKEIDQLEFLAIENQKSVTWLQLQIGCAQGDLQMCERIETLRRRP